MFSFLHLNGEEKEVLHHLIRKAAHMTEYAVLSASLCVLLFYLADIGHWKRVSRLGMMGYAWIFSVLFAVTDEIHQVFVPGRGPAAKDILIDAVGAAFGIALIYVVYRYKRSDK
jgi:VanZ family protein